MEHKYIGIRQNKSGTWYGVVEHKRKRHRTQTVNNYRHAAMLRDLLKMSLFGAPINDFNFPKLKHFYIGYLDTKTRTDLYLPQSKQKGQIK